VLACSLALANAAAIGKQGDAVTNVDQEDEPAFWKQGDAMTNIDQEDKPAFWKA
jgi:hypothetical protein